MNAVKGTFEEIERCFVLHVNHVAGTRMIASGIVGSSRDDKYEGTMSRLDIWSFIPLDLRPTERCDKLQNFVWDVPPAAGEAAVKMLCSIVHCRPHNLHFLLFPFVHREMEDTTNEVLRCILTIYPIYGFWPPEMHEPLIMRIYLPLLPPDYRNRPWQLRNTVFMKEFEIYLRRMQKTVITVDWDILREFLFQARTMSILPNAVARELLQEKSSRSLP